MEQPLPTTEPFEAQNHLLAALGISASSLPIQAYNNGPTHVFVVLDTFDAVASLTPDLRALEALGTFGVSCLAVDGSRVKTRMFGPALGVSEDPATGSAAGCAAAWMVRHGLVAPDEQALIEQGLQISRPSQMFVRASRSADVVSNVRVGGHAVPIMRGVVEI